MREIQPRNKEGKEHGYHEGYFSNGNLWYKGNYINGQEDGYWEWHWFGGGELMSKIYYIEI